MNADNLHAPPPDLPAPVDDGAARHLLGLSLPDLALPSTGGRLVNLGALGSGATVLYCYPRTGRPDEPLPAGWDAIPGARGCTPQACSYRDHQAELEALGAAVYGVSTQPTAYQQEMVARLHLPFEVLSDAAGRFADALHLPTFEAGGERLLKRLTLVTRGGRIEACFYPIFPSDADVPLVLAWLRDRAAPPQGLDPAITDYYDRAPEEARLEQGPFQLEEARTRELIRRFAPPPPGTVLDVGGAAGAYALWLAEAGYSVHLLDPVPRLVAEAKRRSDAARQPLRSCRVGDARDLEVPGDSADVVLLLGPLYHLTDAADRARALHEVARVLKPGGWLFAAAISRWASALDGLARDLMQDARFAAIVERDLRDGQHRNPTDRMDYFTTAYFHRPEELADEVSAAGLTLHGVYGVEGPGWILPDVAERMAHTQSRSALLGVARMLESEPAMLGSSAHLLAVARRPP